MTPGLSTITSLPRCIAAMARSARSRGTAEITTKSIEGSSSSRAGFRGGHLREALLEAGEHARIGGVRIVADALGARRPAGPASGRRYAGDPARSRRSVPCGLRFRFPFPPASSSCPGLSRTWGSRWRAQSMKARTILAGAATTVHNAGRNTHRRGRRTMADRVAVITGAGSGIGRASALALMNDGWSVALAGRRKEMLEETAGMATAGNALVVPTDVTEPAQVDSAVRRGSSEHSAGSTCCSTTPAAARRPRISAISPRRCGQGRRGEPERDVPVRQRRVPHDARPGRRAAGGSSTTARFPRMCRGRAR